VIDVGKLVEAFDALLRSPLGVFRNQAERRSAFGGVQIIGRRLCAGDNPFSDLRAKAGEATHDTDFIIMLFLCVRIRDAYGCQRSTKNSGGYRPRNHINLPIQTGDFFI